MGEGWEAAALWFDYREAANPVRPGLTEPIGLHQWGADLHAQGPTAILPLDLSGALGCPGPATSPGDESAHGKNGTIVHEYTLKPRPGLTSVPGSTQETAR
jgi:hypothetical protein